MRPGIERLMRLRDETAARGRQMDKERGRFAALARPESAARAVAVPLLFQTPPAIAARMAGMLDLGPDDRVLEPSAGLGRLYRAVRDLHDGPMVLVDVSPDCCRELYEMTREDRRVELRQGDFLMMDCGTVDKVVMNPPFRRGLDIRHIHHALEMLRPGGRLVSLCAAGPKQRREFQSGAEVWEDLPAGSFKEAGTNVHAALIVLNK